MGSEMCIRDRCFNGDCPRRAAAHAQRERDQSNRTHRLFAERPPSADRSQQILNSAGRRRDSAARLCSAFLFWLLKHSQDTLEDPHSPASRHGIGRGIFQAEPARQNAPACHLLRARHEDGINPLPHQSLSFRRRFPDGRTRSAFQEPPRHHLEPHSLSRFLVPRPEPRSCGRCWPFRIAPATAV